MAKQSSVNLDITNNVDGFDISGGTTSRTLSVTGGSVTLSGSGSATVTFPTTSTTIAGLGITQSFSALQSFSAGISAAGGVTLGSRVDITGILDVVGGATMESTFDVVGVSRFAGGVTLAGTFSGATGSFSKLLTLSNGLSAAGGFTVGNDISVFGIRVGRGNRGASAGGDTNLAVGANALNSVIPNPLGFAGIQNLAFGTSALQNTTSGGYNSAFGTEALLTNTSGGGNIAFGVHALRQNTSGVENCAFGGGPMYQNTTGSYNVAIGSLAYYFKSTGSHNVAIGFQAGYKFGTPTGSNLTSATNCTLIGNYATPLVNGSSNEIVIGYEAIGKGSNTVSIGNSSITATHLTGVVNIPSGLSAAGGVTLAGTFSGATGSFSRLLTLSGGLSASGATFSGSVFTDNIFSINSQLSLNDKLNTRVAIGDYTGNGNLTYIYLRDNVSILDISNPYGDIRIGDPGAVDSGYFISYNAAGGYLDGGGSALTNWTSGSFSGLLTASAGISAAGGVTFGGTVASDTGYRITSNAIKAQTGTTYTFLESDNGKVLTFNNGSAVTVTIPTALPVGFNCTAIQLGAGQVGFTAASGLTLQSYGNQYRLIGQHASATIIEYSANIVNLSGNLVV